MKIKYLFVLPVVAVLVLSGISLAHAQTFTENLYFGVQGDAQVSQLQEFLTSQNLYSGPITGNFYFLTLGAVKAFQAQQGISPAAGYFGPLTMAASNKIADTEVGASNAQAISETGTSTPPVQVSSTMQLQLEALLKQFALLQQQLQTQQSSTQAIQGLQAQLQQQGQALQQIASSTQTIASTNSQPGQTQAPTANFTANGSSNSITIPYNTAATLSWSSTNTNSCNISPSGWSGLSGNQSTGNLTASQTYSLSCSGTGGSTSASVTVNVSAPVATPGPVKVPFENLVGYGNVYAQGGSMIFLFQGHGVKFDSGSITIASTVYPMVIDSWGSANLTLDVDALGLIRGQNYQVSYQLNAGDKYATETTSVIMPDYITCYPVDGSHSLNGFGCTNQSSNSVQVTGITVKLQTNLGASGTLVVSDMSGNQLFKKDYPAVPSLYQWEPYETIGLSANPVTVGQGSRILSTAGSIGYALQLGTISYTVDGSPHTTVISD